MLIGGWPLEEASEQSTHSGNKSSFLLFLLHDSAYLWYFFANLDISVLQVVSEILFSIEMALDIFLITIVVETFALSIFHFLWR